MLLINYWAQKFPVTDTICIFRGATAVVFSVLARPKKVFARQKTPEMSLGETEVKQG